MPQSQSSGMGCALSSGQLVCSMLCGSNSLRPTQYRSNAHNAVSRFGLVLRSTGGRMRGSVRMIAGSNSIRLRGAANPGGFLLAVTLISSGETWTTSPAFGLHLLAVLQRGSSWLQELVQSENRHLSFA